MATAAGTGAGGTPAGGAWAKPAPAAPARKNITRPQHRLNFPELSLRFTTRLLVEGLIYGCQTS